MFRTSRTQLQGWKPISASELEERGVSPRRQTAPKPMYRDTTRRAVFGESGCTVYAWPSNGGVVIRSQADGVELEFLGFDRLDPPRNRLADQGEEDKLCMMLLKIGGKWWRSEERSFSIEVRDGQGDEPTDEELTERLIGWPLGGGVLVAEYHIIDNEYGTPEGMGRLRMARTMDERCEILSGHFNAKYYADPREYGPFTALFD